MAKYVCSVCGYVYDDEKGTPFSSLSDSFSCPLCGAAKGEFQQQTSSDTKKEVKKKTEKVEITHDMKSLTALESSALCTNLARGCEKQYKTTEAELFRKLADYFKTNASALEEPASMGKLLELINKDLEEGFQQANEVAVSQDDRGALRALVWSEKVTRILKSLLTKYQSQGDKMIQDTGVYVCTICGFIYVGDSLPEICPVCKVPNWKFEKIEEGA